MKTQQEAIAELFNEFAERLSALTQKPRPARIAADEPVSPSRAEMLEQAIVAYLSKRTSGATAKEISEATNIQRGEVYTGIQALVRHGRKLTISSKRTGLRGPAAQVFQLAN